MARPLDFEKVRNDYPPILHGSHKSGANGFDMLRYGRVIHVNKNCEISLDQKKAVIYDFATATYPGHDDNDPPVLYVMSSELGNLEYDLKWTTASALADDDDDDKNDVVTIKAALGELEKIEEKLDDLDKNRISSESRRKEERARCAPILEYLGCPVTTLEFGLMWLNAKLMRMSD